MLVEAMSDQGRPWRWPAKQEPTEALGEPSGLTRCGRNPRHSWRGGGQLPRYTAERPHASPREGMVERALVLNASYQPICVVPVRRAVVLVLKEKAEVLVPGSGLVRGATLELQAPSVIRLRYFVKVPFRARAGLSRRAVFVRDDHTCQYCGERAENVDHVVGSTYGRTWSPPAAAATARRRTASSTRPASGCGASHGRPRRRFGS